MTESTENPLATSLSYIVVGIMTIFFVWPMIAGGWILWGAEEMWGWIACIFVGLCLGVIPGVIIWGCMVGKYWMEVM